MSKDKKRTKKFQHRLGTQERADQLNRGGVTLTMFKRNKPNTTIKESKTEDKHLKNNSKDED